MIADTIHAMGITQEHEQQFQKAVGLLEVL